MNPAKITNQSLTNHMYHVEIICPCEGHKERVHFGDQHIGSLLPCVFHNQKVL